MKRDNPNNSEMREILRRLAALESASPLESSSVSNGRLRFIGGLLRVDSGGRVEIVGVLQVAGSTQLIGPVTVEGAVSVTGDVHATGEWTQVGPWHLNGEGSIAGDVDITGILTLLSELVVSSVGKITVGNLALDPSSNGGSVKFSGGPEVYASGTELSLYSGGGGSFATLSPSSAKLNGPGARWLEVTATAIRAVGLPTIARASANNAVVGSVWADASGNLYRVVL